MTTLSKLLACALRAACPSFGVKADLVGYQRPSKLPANNRALLAALVPTSALFSKMTTLDAQSVWWSLPDIVLENSDGRRYIVEVCTDDTLPRVARKFENIVAAAESEAIAGCAFVHRADNGKRFNVKETQLLERTVFEVLGSEHVDVSRSTWLDFFRPLLDRHGTRIYGDVSWDRFREWDFNDDTASEIAKHAGVLLTDSDKLCKR